MTLRVQLLGGFRVWSGTSALPEKTLSRKKVRSVFKMLALHPAHRLLKDALIEELWADLEPEQGAAQLYNALYNLRKAFQPFSGIEVGLSRGEIVLQAEGGVVVDALDFEKFTLTALKSRAFTELLDALNLWTGEFSPEDLYDDWSEPYRMRFSELRLQLLLVLGEEALGRGNLEQAQQAFSTVLEVFPASEGAHVGLMRLSCLLKNRDQLVRHFERYSAATFEEFGEAPPAHVQDIFEQLKTTLEQELEKEITVLPASPSVTAVLPGRQAELERLHALFAEGARLVTILGMGGQGKTRLARAFCEQLAGPHLLVSAESCFGVPDLQDRLRLQLQIGEEKTSVLDVLALQGEVLLVLDNLEQVQGIEDWVNLALTRVHGLRILCTSRRPLQVAEEQLLELSGLDPGTAMQLFCALALKSNPEFTLTPTDETALHALCVQVGGSPLALELAAGWVRLMTVPEILEEVQDSLDFLDAGPQKNLSQVLMSTWERLESAEQEALKALSTFAGSFNVQQAKNTFQIRPQVLIKLSQLGLVQKNGAQLNLHPLIRQMARSHLEANSPHLLQHARHHLELLNRNHSILNGADRHAYHTALEHTRQLMPEVLPAMQEALRGQPELFRDSCVAFSEACLFSFLLPSGLALLQQGQLHADPSVQDMSLLCLAEIYVWQGELAAALGCLENCNRKNLAEDLHYRWFLHRGLVAERQGQFQDSVGFFQAGLEVATFEQACALLHMQLGDACAAKSLFAEASEAYNRAGLLSITQNNPRLYASLIMRLGTLAGRTEQWGTAEERFLQAIQVFSVMEDTGNLNRAVNNLSLVYLSTGRYQEAREHIQHSLIRARLFRSPGTLTALLNNLSVACLASGDLQTARESAQESLKICRESGFSRRVPSCLLHLGDIHLAAREFELAHMVFKEAHALFQGWNPLSQLDNLCGHSWVLAELDRHEEARLLLQEGEALLQKHPSRRLRFHATRAYLEWKAGHSSIARSLLMSALNAYDPVKDELHLGWVLPSLETLQDATFTQELCSALAQSNRVHWLHKTWAAQQDLQTPAGTAADSIRGFLGRSVVQ
ncbi:tetratricopeptide repeat protein [Deinococcus roseus]|uniref:Bacterial transcriptional activator domain-containing protein n=1 Tax=Deinococcus roseus TaxID=392414 RepID=A0ABQ2CWF9_9DEIO|nr:tetratricopeptide repeat protein [Deinococcus roseus]GGJ27618.1 hypothetical protein GCM10008938_12140 [Deinococcus roseus]